MTKFDSDTLAGRFARHHLDFRDAKFLCAVSGGLDSIVLLHAMHSLEASVRCVHVNHGLQAQAQLWSEFCESRADELGYEFINLKVQLSGQDNLEERCRDARYKLLAEYLHKDEILLTAHHLDDQIETFFLQLMRGAGPTGLQAMSSASVIFAAGLHFRPLLSFTRSQLHDYALLHKLRWMEDPSNQQSRFERNFLRNEVLPNMLDRRPGNREAISRSIELIGESASLLEQLAAIDARISADGLELEFSVLRDLDDCRIANAIRFWLAGVPVRLPNRERLLEAIRQFKSADEDRLPVLEWSGNRVTRYRNALHFSKSMVRPAGVSLAVHQEDWIELPAACGRLRLCPVTGGGINAATIPVQNLHIRFREFGERIRRASGHHQTLKQWLQERGIPPDQRALMPLLFYRDDLIAIADLWIDARYRAVAGEPGWTLHWERSATSD